MRIQNSKLRIVIEFHWPKIVDEPEVVAARPEELDRLELAGTQPVSQDVAEVLGGEALRPS